MKTALIKSCLLIAVTAVILTFPTKVAAVGLTFDQPVKKATKDHQLGKYTSAKVIDFLNVANQDGQWVDMRLTTSVSGSYSYVGTFPNYNSPAGDLGVLYQANNYGSGILNFEMEFYLSGSNFSSRYTLSELNLLVYDVDGESTQTEAFRAFLEDGLVSYRLADSPFSVSATPGINDILFSGPGFDVNEHDSTGAVLLSYRNTDSVKLQFESTTSRRSALPNGVFSAIDGNPTINTTDFQKAVAVPEPSSALGVLIGGLMFVIRRKRRA